MKAMAEPASLTVRRVERERERPSPPSSASLWLLLCELFCEDHVPLLLPGLQSTRSKVSLLLLLMVGSISRWFRTSRLKWRVQQRWSSEGSMALWLLDHWREELSCGCVEKHLPQKSLLGPGPARCGPTPCERRVPGIARSDLCQREEQRGDFQPPAEPGSTW